MGPGERGHRPGPADTHMAIHVTLQPSSIPSIGIFTDHIMLRTYLYPKL